MKVLLVNPVWRTKKGGIWNEVAGCSMPVGLGILASCLENVGVEVKILDANALNVSDRDSHDYICRDNFDYLGFTSTSYIVHEALRMASLCRKMRPNVKIIFGGVHPTIFPEEVLSYNCVDFVIRGEGEKPLVQLITGGDPSKVAGLSYKRNGEFIHNPEDPLVENLDTLPFPAYHLFPMPKYHPALGGFKRLPAINMITSRGCPGRCTFCYKSMFGVRTRARSPESLVKEIEMLIRDYGIKEIVFYDDTFTVSKDRVKKFCSLLADKKIDLTWSCMSRIDYVNDEILYCMKKIGCHQICYGIESGDEQILKNIQKPLSLERAEKICRLTKDCGITVRLSFMLGSPGETQESMGKTISFAKKLKPDIVQFNITTPYPGTAMFNWAKEKGYLTSLNWHDYDLCHMVMKLPTVSPELVEKYYHLAYRKFYFRPSYIIHRLRKTLTPLEIMLNVKAFFRMIKVAMAK